MVSPRGPAESQGVGLTAVRSTLLLADTMRVMNVYACDTLESSQPLHGSERASQFTGT
jgi:hypothetical protein